jgi:probable rRNA maturation factor
MGRAARITINCHVGGKHAAFLQKKLRAALSRLGSVPAGVTVTIVGARAMSALHWRFLGKRSATDVLSFEVEHDARGRVVEGEIVVCLDIARRESGRRGHPVENELLLYALHGLLHLCGYDDATDAGFARIHAEEDRILTAIGVGPVFGPRKSSR